MKPIFRLFKLGLDLNYQADYEHVGYENLKNSIEKEAGTLAMYVNHISQDKSQQRVVELYRDDTAYQKHTASNHFQAFAQLAGKALTSRQVITLEARLLLEKRQALKVLEANHYAIRLAEVAVKEEHNSAFAASVLSEMRVSMDKEEGVLVMLAGTDADQPNHWYFYEIYQNEASYENHRQTEHFQAYIAETADWVTDKKIFELTGDLLVNRGGLALSF